MSNPIEHISISKGKGNLKNNSKYMNEIWIIFSISAIKWHVFFLPEALTPIKTQYSRRELQRINPDHWRAEENFSSFSLSLSLNLALVLFSSRRNVPMRFLYHISQRSQLPVSQHIAVTIQYCTKQEECLARAKPKILRTDKKLPLLKRVHNTVVIGRSKLERIDCVFICAQAENTEILLFPIKDA